MGMEMPAIPVNRVVNPKRIIRKNGGPRRRRGTRGRWPPPPPPKKIVLRKSKKKVILVTLNSNDWDNIEIFDETRITASIKVDFCFPNRATRCACEKNRPKCSPIHFLSKLTHMYLPFSVERGSPKIWSISVFYQRLSKQNNCPIGPKFALSGLPAS
jgi:hypothetical protein